MTDSLADHLREHDRGHYERVELRRVEGVRLALDVPDPPVLTPADLERIYQESLAWRHAWRKRTEGMASR